MNQKVILISNDDGYDSRGLASLIDMLQPLGYLIICAPDGPRSGSSCAFTVTQPLRLTLHRRWKDGELWSASGTPVDCVKLAFSELCRDRRPDLVVGGINHGDNSSVNSHYSGTMGVVMEGAMKGIPSVGFSLCDHRADADFSPLTPYVRSMSERLLREGLPLGVCLNVNFPLAETFEGVRVCRMANGVWHNEIESCTHPRGYQYYWITGQYTDLEPDAQDTDSWALAHGYVAITPTAVDVTAHTMINNMKASGWENVK